VYGFVVVLLAFLALYPLAFIINEVLIGPHSVGTVIRTLVSSPAFREALVNSLTVATVVTIVCVLVGVPAAWFVTVTDMPGRGLFRSLFLLCYMTPSFIFATAYVILLGRAGVLNKFLVNTFALSEPPFTIFSMGGLILVVSLFCFPFVFLSTSAALEGLDPTFAEAARISGGSPLTTIRHVTLPLVTPAIKAGAILSFVQSITLFGAPIYLGVPARIPILTTEIYKYMATYPSRFDLAAAISVVLMGLSLIPLVLQNLTRGEARRFVTIAGRSAGTRLLPLGKARPLALAFCLSLAAISVFLPYGIILLTALRKHWTDPISLENLTLEHFAWVLSDRLTVRGIGNSFLLGGVSAAIIVLLSLFAAYAVLRARGVIRLATDFLSLIPLAIPGTTLAVGLVLAYIRPPLRLYGTVWLFLIAYVTHFMPLAVRVLEGSLVQLDPVLEEAARMAGASWVRGFRSIVAPLLKPAMAAAFILVFIPAMKEFTIGILIYRMPWVTMSIALYEIYTAGQYERVTALATVFMILVLAVFALAQRFLRRPLVA